MKNVCGGGGLSSLLILFCFPTLLYCQRTCHREKETLQRQLDHCLERANYFYHHLIYELSTNATESKDNHSFFETKARLM